MESVNVMVVGIRRMPRSCCGIVLCHCGLPLGEHEEEGEIHNVDGVDSIQESQLRSNLSQNGHEA